MTTTKKTREPNAIVNTEKMVIVSRETVNDETVKTYGLGRSKYAARIETDTLKETEFNVHSLEKVVSNKYEIRVNSKGFCLYSGKERSVDIKVQNGKVKIFNRADVAALAELGDIVRIETDLPQYKLDSGFTNCIFTENKDAVRVIRTVLKNS